MVKELDLTEQFRDLNLVYEVTHKSVRLGMLKITNSLLDEIMVGADGIVRLQDRVCIPSVPNLRKLILEDGHRSSSNVHSGAIKMY
ncbi:hypothetical protein CR513_44783, partial [Mucuna pruriens]